jgi:hypothetical protein
MLIAWFYIAIWGASGAVGVALTCRGCLWFLGILVLARGVVDGEDFGAERSRVGVKERKF